MTEHDNADEVTRLRADRRDLIRINKSLVERAEALLSNLDRLVREANRDAESAEAALNRVREALDIRTRARAWMTHLGYEDHQIDAAEAWRQPREPWLHDDPPTAVVDLETAVGIAREYDEAIRAALDPASPATRPSPAPADDVGTGTGAAPSEGHSEARGALCRHGKAEGEHDCDEWRDYRRDRLEFLARQSDPACTFCHGSGACKDCEGTCQHCIDHERGS